MSFRLVYVVLEPPLAAALARAAGRAAQQAGVPLVAQGFLIQDVAQPEGQRRLAAALAEADIFLGAVITLDAEAQAVAQALRQHRPPVTAIFHSQPEVTAFTRLGDLDALTWHRDGTLARIQAALAAAPAHGAPGAPAPPPHALLAALPHLARHLPPDQFPGARAYAEAARLWAEGTEEALAALVLHLLNQHPAVAGRLKVPSVAPLPQVALWHPAAGRHFAELAEYQAWLRGHLPDLDRRPAVAVLLSRRWVAAGDTDHFAAAIAGLEAEGLACYPAFSDLDVAPLVDRYWLPARVEALVNLSAMNLVGGHGRPDPARAVAALERLDVPCLAPVPVIFQTLDQWRAGQRGLLPAQLVMQVVLPELEGQVEPWVWAGTGGGGRTHADPEALTRLCRRVRRWVDLRRTPPAQRRIAITLFSNPPGKGTLGTAAYLDVFRSLWHLLQALKAEGYTVEVPPDPEALLLACLGGPEARHGSAHLPVAGRVSLRDLKRWLPDWQHLTRIWGPPPGELDTDGQDILIFGRAFGNVFVGVQPAFGYEGDPLRLLLSPDFTPSYAFCAYYAWLRHAFGAHAVLHFGTHGALEFMPGKQVGLGPGDWPARLIGDLPHLYFYAVNNPSEASIAKRRGRAVTVGYRTPPLAQAGLGRTLLELQETLAAWRQAETDHARRGAWEAIRALAQRAHLDEEVPPPGDAPPAAGDAPAQGAISAAAQAAYVDRLAAYLQELAARLIPLGLRVAGEPASAAEVEETLRAASHVPRLEWGGRSLPDLVGPAAGRILAALAAGGPGAAAAAAAEAGVAEGWQVAAPLLAALWQGARDEVEIPALLRALAGRYIPPGPGGDPLRNPAVLPAGRNLHALDPWRAPTPAAWHAGKLAAEALIRRLTAGGQPLPPAVAVVLWGTDNIKTGGEGIAQALWLLGAEPVADSLGRITRVRLIPLAELGRPRLDVVVTCSGIFRDLFPSTLDLIQQAVALAAAADEPEEMNYVRRHARELSQELGISLAEAARRVFAARPGHYGTGVNHAVAGGAWESTADLGRLYVERMGYAHGGGEAVPAQRVLAAALRRVGATVQNLDSAELSLADVDHYFEHLGGLTAAVAAARGQAPAAWVVDATAGPAQVRTLQEALRLEARTRLLNPRWYEAMLRHGFQGAAEVAARLDHTYGWLATTGRVDGWVLDEAADLYLLDVAMRRRLAAANPHAARRMAARLLEAAHRGLWRTDPARLHALQVALAELEDALEGVAS